MMPAVSVQMFGKRVPMYIKRRNGVEWLWQDIKNYLGKGSISVHCTAFRLFMGLKISKNKNNTALMGGKKKASFQLSPLYFLKY